MPRQAPELTAVDIRRLERPGFHAVGGVSGLHLRISSTGGKSWILRATVGDRRRDIGLGGFPSVTLSQARDLAREARLAIREGRDPVQERKAARQALIAASAKAMTFREATERFLARKTSEFRNPKHAAQWRSTLETYSWPVLGEMEVQDIELAHVVRTLEPIWQSKTETASRLRGRIEAVLAWATVSGFRSGDNPARWRGNLEAVLPKPAKIAKQNHHAAMPIDDIPDFMRSLRKRDGMSPAALEFLVLTAARSGEVRGANWEEVDLEKGMWTIPAERMKAGREHRVPLSPAAIAILEALSHRTGLLFPAPRGGSLSDMALSAVTRRMGVVAVPHGFRSTFRDWAAERTDYPHEMQEMALAHTIGNKTEAAYRRGDLLEKRRQMMTDWAEFCVASE